MISLLSFVSDTEWLLESVAFRAETHYAGLVGMDVLEGRAYATRRQNYTESETPSGMRGCRRWGAPSQNSSSAVQNLGSAISTESEAVHGTGDYAGVISGPEVRPNAGIFLF